MARSVDSVLGFCRCYAFPVLVFSYVLFILAGGAVFMVLEQPEEDLLVSEVLGLRAGFLQDHPCVEESSLDELVRTVLSAGRRGVSEEEEDQDQEYNFDFTSSLFFVTTFLTTTGYGTTIPLSDEGRVFCMLYCLVGIPLTLLLLSCLTHALLPRVTHAPIRHLQLYWVCPTTEQRCCTVGCWQCAQRRCSSCCRLLPSPCWSETGVFWSLCTTASSLSALSGWGIICLGEHRVRQCGRGWSLPLPVTWCWGLLFCWWWRRVSGSCSRYRIWCVSSSGLV
uniref:Potassium channel, subfamily K, member 7 n=1 Tax=Astyanax mexicanus TaxID=7994 RepID=W5KF31_ASTMX